MSRCKEQQTSEFSKNSEVCCWDHGAALLLGQGLEGQRRLPDRDAVVFSQRPALHADAVDQGAVRRPQVDYEPDVVDAFDAGMAAGSFYVVDGKLVVCGASNGQPAGGDVQRREAAQGRANEQLGGRRTGHRRALRRRRRLFDQHPRHGRLWLEPAPGQQAERNEQNGRNATDGDAPDCQQQGGGGHAAALRRGLRSLSRLENITRLHR